MKKLSLFVVLFSLSFLFSFSFMFDASASSVDNGVLVMARNNCEGYFGDKTDVQAPAYWMQKFFDIMKYVGIVALIGLSIMDFFKAVVSNDKDALKKATSTASKRFVYCILLFFLPMIVDFLMTIFGAYGSCVG